MFQDYLQALVMIFIAEMGDKTQILAMAFATKYKVRYIVLGVAIGAFLNHGLAIILGSFLTRFVPMDLMQLIAGFMFLFFAFWSLKADDDDEEETAGKYGPIMTVAVAFFVGELGDKTQLTALTLSTQAAFPILTLMGTVTGMVLTSMVGILIGAKLGHKIPEMQLKLGAFGIFVFFGLEKVLRSPYTAKLPLVAIIVALVFFVVLSVWSIRRFVMTMQGLKETAFVKQAQALYNFVHNIQPEVESLCLGVEHCDVCEGSMCLVGYMKQLMQKLSRGEAIDSDELQKMNERLNRDFDKDLAKSILRTLLSYYDQHPESYLKEVSLIGFRMALENIIFGETITQKESLEAYKTALIKKDSSLGLRTL